MTQKRLKASICEEISYKVCSQTFGSLRGIGMFKHVAFAVKMRGLHI